MMTMVNNSPNIAIGPIFAERSLYHGALPRSPSGGSGIGEKRYAQ